ncbi:hypothetical protein ACTAQJ_19020 [Arthrobacter sp. alpha11c]
MEDPTTLAINLTYLGTVGMAILMFLGLGLVIIITLVVAGVGRLVSVILLAMIGVFPKKETVTIVHLPPAPEHVPAPASDDVEYSSHAVESPLEDLAYVPAGSTAEVAANPVVAEPKKDLLGDVRRRLSGASSAVKDGAWKVGPKKVPKPALVKEVVETQTAHHPLLVAASKEPPVLAKDWADAVAEADRRAAERAKAEEPPAIKVTVREVGEPTPPSSNEEPPAPKAPDAQQSSGTEAGPGNGPKKSGPEYTKSSQGNSSAQGNNSKKSGPNTSKNGKPSSPVRKGSLSGVSRNS